MAEQINNSGYEQAVDNTAYQYYLITKNLLDTIDMNCSIEERLAQLIGWEDKLDEVNRDKLDKIEEILYVISKTYNKNYQELHDDIIEKALELTIKDALLL